MKKNSFLFKYFLRTNKKRMLYNTQRLNKLELQKYKFTYQLVYKISLSFDFYE